MKRKNPEWINATEARELLGVARATFSRIVREKILTYETNPLNKKEKLFRKRQVVALKARYKR